jgi:hypothetical protein
VSGDGLTRPFEPDGPGTSQTPQSADAQAAPQDSAEGAADQPPLRRGQTWAHWKGVIRRAGIDLIPAALLVAAFTATAWILPLVGGPPVLELVDSPLPRAAVVGWLALGITLWGVLLVWERGSALARVLREPTREILPLGAAIRRFGPRRTHRVVAAVGGAVLINFFMPTFLGFKASIPEIQTFGLWDRWFIELDRVLHGGIHPWELLHPFLARPWITRSLDWMYYAWFYVAVFGFLILAVRSAGPKRSQFFLAFTGMWIFLGIVAATAMASAGPCFVGYLEGVENPYQGLMAYLHSVHASTPLTSLHVQSLLWESYQNPSGALTTGIAAMPSLHVALPGLYAVATWRRNRRWSVLLWAFTGLILLGSVHLGWHYAVDGYVSIAALLPLWIGSGWVVQRFRRIRSGVTGRPNPLRGPRRHSTEKGR